MKQQPPLTFRDFAAIYERSADFPPSAREWVPPSLWEAIDGGNDVFFAPLKKHQPLTYRTLTEQCGRIGLLARQWSNPWAGGARQTNFYWGLMCGERLIVPNLPLGERIGEIREEYLRALPRGLHGYYESMDGMTIPGALLSAMVHNDLPASRTLWRDLDDYRKHSFQTKKKLEKINRSFAGHELRIVVYGTRGDLVLVDFTAKDQRLIHVQNHAFDDYRVIPHAVERLDRYFANAIRGFPEPVDLRS